MSNQPTNLLPSRYLRSVNLASDYADSQQGIHGYQSTPLVLQTTEQILSGLQPGAKARAFSIIGPYGAGKSAYALFLAHLLRESPSVRRRLFATHGLDMPPETPLNGPRLLPVLVGGNNASLRTAILAAIQRMLANQPLLKHAELSDELAALLAAPMIDPQQVAAIVFQANTLVATKMAFQGIALLIDELGQFLDFAARQNDERELFVLQALAEGAARSADTPLLIVTILHQSFERYTAHAGATRRAEWAKVQGRFVDLPFQEPPVQMLRMVGTALMPTAADRFATERHFWANQPEALALRPAEVNEAEWRTLLARAYPLHPLVLVALPLLFRQLAQNERSLFAFLTSHEPFSVQDVLASAPTGSAPVYRLSDLYAYVHATLGASLFGRARGQRWAELAEARAQVPAGDRVMTDVLTSIGTLGALGQVRGLHANRSQLSFALRGEQHDGGYAEADIERALNELAARKHIAFRQHRDSFVIWEGSDLDLDGLTNTARRDLADRVAFVDLLRQYAAPTPLVARKHSYRFASLCNMEV